MKPKTAGPGFLARGWSFPPAFDPFAGGAVMREAEEHIKQSIRLILSIMPGERPMVPDFGCNLLRYAFAPVDVTMATRIELEVQRALLRFEPRIVVDQVTAVPGDASGQRVIVITVAYTIRSTNRRDNVVFPYHCHESAGVPE